jgi:hypothetical protein
MHATDQEGQNRFTREPLRNFKFSKHSLTNFIINHDQPEKMNFIS